jgi:hypothetical protein
MEKLIIQATDDTPEVLFDKTSGTFILSGKSLPEDVIEFYSPIFQWMEKYSKDPLEETKLMVKISYFNSASQRALNEIFIILSRIVMKGKKVEVEWHYSEDDDEMREAGQEFAEITNLPFMYKSYILD